MAGRSGFGTQLQLGDGETPETFTTIAQVSSISGPSLALNAIDVTAHDSTGGWAEFVGGILDAGEITLDINFDPNQTTHNDLRGVLVSRAVRNFRLVFPVSPSVTWQFAGLVTGYEISAPIDDKLSASVTIKISGAPSFAD